MNIATACIGALCVAAAAWLGYANLPREITEQSLSAQLSGTHCRFQYAQGICAQRGIHPLSRLLVQQHDCEFWAVQCLAQFNTPEAHRIMSGVLASRSDIQTCDGVVPIRGHAVTYLGNSADKAALGALRELLASQPMQRLSPGATGCEAVSEDINAIRAAISKLEQQ